MGKETVKLTLNLIPRKENLNFGWFITKKTRFKSTHYQKNNTLKKIQLNKHTIFKIKFLKFFWNFWVSSFLKIRASSFHSDANVKGRFSCFEFDRMEK